MNNEGPTVFVIDDDAGVRDSLRRLVHSIGLSAELYESSKTFLEAVSPGRPGCIVLDVWLPEMNGLEVLKILTSRKIHTPIIMMSGYADVAIAVEAMKSGVYDFLEKPFSVQRMLESIQNAIVRDRALRHRHHHVGDVRTRVMKLSKRERQIMNLVVAGMTSNEIAMQLGIQLKTVGVHRSHINNKMKARNAADLVRLMSGVSDLDEDPTRLDADSKADGTTTVAG